MGKVMFWYGMIAVTLQLISFSYIMWGVLGVIIALAVFPIGALVTAFGAFFVFGAWLPFLNIIILLVGASLMER